MKTKLKTIIFVCNNKGGIGKSTTAGFVGDALHALGYTVLFLSGDKTSNLALRQLHPTKHYDIKDSVSMDEAMHTAMGAEKDIVIFDLPGFSSDTVAAYFAEQDYQTFRDAGLRFVAAIVATQHKDSVAGGIEWIETFLENAEPIIFANGQKTPDGEAIDLSKINGGSDLIDIADGRIVEVPKFSPRMMKQYNEHPAVPSSYLPNGEAGKKLGLNMLSASPWRKLHTHVMRSLSEHAEWLVGKPIPKPFDLPESGIATLGTNAALERLKSKYKDAMTDNTDDQHLPAVATNKLKSNE